MKKIFLTALSLFVLFSCVNSGTKKESAALPKWLVGEWVSRQDSVEFLERWTFKNDSLLEGRGMAYKGTDTLFSERLEMRKKGDTLYYVPTVSGQNGGQPVWFKVVVIDSVGFSAENPAHDFPQRIDYQLRGEDSVYAILSGKEGGQQRTEVFPMKKR